MGEDYTLNKYFFSAGHPDKTHNSVYFDPLNISNLMNFYHKWYILETLREIAEIGKLVSKKDVDKLILTIEKKYLEYVMNNIDEIDLKILDLINKEARKLLEDSRYIETLKKADIENLDEYLNKRLIKYKLLSKMFNIGIIYYDRLRFRYACVIPGEHIYSVSLSPNEEVTIAHKSITRRSIEFEDVITKEEEKSLEFDSNWSTDIMNSITTTESKSENSGWNIGGSLSANYKGVSAGISGGYSSSTSESKQKSINDQTKYMTSLTEKTSNRMRSEHITSIKNSEEYTDETLFKRYLKNNNFSKPITYVFYKLYNKYRIMLERTNEDFGIQFDIIDPCIYLRNDFMSTLAKYDSKEIIHNINVEVTDVTKNVVLHPKNVSPFFTWPPPYLLGEVEFDLEPHSVINDIDVHVLSIKDREYHQDGWGGPLRRAPNEIEDMTLSEKISYYHINPFIVDAPDTPFHLQDSNKFKIKIRSECIEFYPENITVEVKLEVTTEQALQNNKQAIEYTENKIIEEGTKFIDYYVDLLKIKEKEFLLKDIQNLFILQYIDEYKFTQPSLSYEIKDILSYFDWEKMTVKWYPWWITEKGKMIHHDLFKKLTMYPEVRDIMKITEGILTASKADIVVPFIDHENAKKFLIEYLWKINYDYISIYSDVFKLIDEFYKYKNETYDKKEEYVQKNIDYMGPGLEKFTKIGNKNWKYNWELFNEKSYLLKEWNGIFPTDGVHIEPIISHYDSVDELKFQKLSNE